ncbi:hypothetical protein AAFF_G00386030 [Aldrovandia affinis]|uniref:Uncharacterized protein n=1 Tax=Aldrovandia affinis TaxID=143900 RepID=A0AAD7SEZ7_9TELE|nr:hypothetical protein AAFF_G00386030 [Aldrovandia affinis]
MFTAPASVQITVTLHLSEGQRDTTDRRSGHVERRAETSSVWTREARFPGRTDVSAALSLPLRQRTSTWQPARPALGLVEWLRRFRRSERERESGARCGGASPPGSCFVLGNRAPRRADTERGRGANSLSAVALAHSAQEKQRADGSIKTNALGSAGAPACGQLKTAALLVPGGGAIDTDDCLGERPIGHRTQ